MDQSAQKVLQRALREQMEKEAGQVPPVEKIQAMHRFSQAFLKNMERLTAKAREDEKRQIQERQEQKKGKIQFFTEKNTGVHTSGKTRRLCPAGYARIAVLCACCVLVVGLGWRALRLSGSGSFESASGGMDSGSKVTPQESTAETADIGEGGAGWMPLESLDAEEIAQVKANAWQSKTDFLPEEAVSEIETEQQAAGEDKQFYENEKDRVQKLAAMLKELMVYEEIPVDSLPETQAEYRIQKADGTELSISVYEAAVLIDGTAYRAEEEDCEQLILFSEEFQQLSGEE